LNHHPASHRYGGFATSLDVLGTSPGQEGRWLALKSITEIQPPGITISRMKRTLLTGVTLAGLSVGALAGHHSISGAYDTSREITLEGVVTRFQFINPHPFVTIAVVGRAGESQQWRLEMDNRFELVQIGMKSESLKPGDRVIVMGSPGRAESQTLYIRRLDRPEDGFRYEQIGYEPRVQFIKKQ
jgi:hypothetical protein